MYAIIETGGQQFKVSPGDSIKVQKLSQEEGSEISLGKVLMVSKDDETRVGDPFIKDAAVKAEIRGEVKSRKVLVYKKKPRKGYKRLNGHRQNYTVLAIKDIVFGG